MKYTAIKTNELCQYGCGNLASFKNLSGKMQCDTSPNKCPAIKEKNSKSIKKLYSEGKKDCSHFDGKRGWAKNKILKSEDEIFTKKSFLSTGYIKNALIKLNIFKYECKICQQSKWLGKKLSLHLDHIDGDNTNNLKTNLRFLCPNCHSQTETYCGKNINKGKIKVSDDELVKAINESKNVRQSLILVGLTPKGANYERVYNLINRYNLEFYND